MRFRLCCSLVGVFASACAWMVHCVYASICRQTAEHVSFIRSDRWLILVSQWGEHATQFASVRYVVGKQGPLSILLQFGDPAYAQSFQHTIIQLIMLFIGAFTSSTSPGMTLMLVHCMGTAVPCIYGCLLVHLRLINVVVMRSSSRLPVCLRS